MKIILVFLFLICITSVKAQFDHQNVSLYATFDDASVTAEPVYQIRYQSCWGWEDPADHREYGIIGSTSGTYVIDVTDPSNPVQRAYIPGRSNNRIWHEYKSYQNYLYIIADGGGNTLQIVDLSYLPDSVHVVYDDDGIFDSGHTLYVDGNRLYVASVSNPSNYSSMNVYDISQPEVPVLLRQLDQDYPSISQVHDMYVVNDTAYASCAYQGLYIFRYDEVQNRFIQIGSLTTYPDEGYNHSSFLSEDHSTLYMCDEVPAGLAVKVVDVTTISNPVVIDTFYTHTGDTPHNPYVKGNYLYLAAYQDGVYIYDISVPSQPVLSGYFDTHPQNPPGTYPSPPYAGCWAVYPDLPSGIILASDMQLGLFILNASAATGVQSIQDAGMSLYPNPSSGILRGRAASLRNAEVEYSLFDLSGREYLHSTATADFTGEFSLDASGLENGAYLLNAYGPQGNFTARVSIIR